jgi:hypothetical protein
VESMRVERNVFFKACRCLNSPTADCIVANLLFNDQEVSHDVGIDVRNSLGYVSNESEYWCQERLLILNLRQGLSLTNIQRGVRSVEREACRRR